MARERVVRITSDLTGVAYEGEDFPPVDVSVNGKKAKLDLTPTDTEALTAFVGGDPEPLRKLILQTSGATVTKPGRRARSGSGSGSRAGDDGRNALIRAWADSPAATARVKEWSKGLPGGKATGARGRMPAYVGEDYDAARPGRGVSAASGPSEPAN